MNEMYIGTTTSVRAVAIKRKKELERFVWDGTMHGNRR